MPSLSRRRFLRLAALGSTPALAGCSLRSQSRSSRPPGDGRAGPAPTCADEYDGFEPLWVVDGPGPLGGFDLTVHTPTITVGNTLWASLRNVTLGTRTTGVKHLCDIQYRASDGWHTIFGAPDDFGWLDLGISHGPGQGFTWTVPFTRDGLSSLNSQYHTCSALEPGTYRFVYWGLTTEREEHEDYETDYALGATFTVIDD